MGDWANKTMKPIIQIRRPFATNTVSSTIPTDHDRRTLETFLDESIENGPIVREALLEMGTTELDRVGEAEFNAAAGEVAAKQLRLAMLVLKPLVEYIEENGFADCHLAIGKSYYKDEMLKAHSGFVSFGDLLIDRPIWDPDIGYVGYQTEKLGIHHIRLATGFLRAGVSYAERAQAHPETIQEAKHLADLLDAAAENGYRGKEEEGTGLEEWLQTLKN
jgi:hypothetical protein